MFTNRLLTASFVTGRSLQWTDDTKKRDSDRRISNGSSDTPLFVQLTVGTTRRDVVRVDQARIPELVINSSHSPDKRPKTPYTWCTPFLVSLHMRKEKFGVAIDKETVQEVDDLVAESADLGASRSEIIEAILTTFVQSESNYAERVREIIIRKRNGLL